VRHSAFLFDVWTKLDVSKRNQSISDHKVTEHLASMCPGQNALLEQITYLKDMG